MSESDTGGSLIVIAVVIRENAETGREERDGRERELIIIILFYFYFIFLYQIHISLKKNIRKFLCL